MPRLDLTISHEALSAAAKRTLPAELSACMLRWESAADTPFSRSIAWTHVHEMAQGATHDANGPTDAPHIILDVTIPAGALSERRRAELIREATELISKAAGLDATDGNQIWILVHEVTEGFWGAAGQVVRYAQLGEQVRREAPQAGAS
jgi:phenylpyruvate tautomerase PptA (4-oxalocrotonate tautomerase family)